MVYVGYFNNVFLSSDQGLKLNLAPSTTVVTQNNQTFLGNPGGHTLVVIYSQTTRSIPPQTTPTKSLFSVGSKWCNAVNGRPVRPLTGMTGRPFLEFHKTRCRFSKTV